nr:unnamed protein product [Naegleria fowleri]
MTLFNPLKDGLLLLGVNGQGTKALNYIQDSNYKVYEFIIQCGSCTPSYDAQTIQFAKHCHNYKYFFEKNCQSIEQVNAKIEEYLKERNNYLIQNTPVFSAVKKGGKRLAKYGHQKLEKLERIMFQDGHQKQQQKHHHHHPHETIKSIQEEHQFFLDPIGMKHPSTTENSTIQNDPSQVLIEFHDQDSSMMIEFNNSNGGMYNEEEHIPKRHIRIDRLECTGIDKEKGQLSFSCTCSTGTYIRVLGYELSHLLEVCGAYVIELHRSQIGKLSTMLRLEDLGNHP